MVKFDRFRSSDGAMYVCRICKKRTRETGEGESSCQLCKNCYERGTLENDHNDYGHAQKVDNCPECEKLKNENEIWIELDGQLMDVYCTCEGFVEVADGRAVCKSCGQTELIKDL